MVAELDGSLVIKDELSGSEDRPEDLGIALAERLLIKGADRILEGFMETRPADWSIGQIAKQSIPILLLNDLTI
jgi:hypothetical protein